MLDGIQQWHLWSGLVASLILFGIVYAGLHHFAGTSNGLVAPEGECVHWYDFFYFSAVTEATLGYGDFRPTGWSKLAAVSQVSFGLFWVGLLISKLASSRTKRSRLLARSFSGWWYDAVTTSTGVRLIGIIQFYVDESGLLRFKGTNYLRDGTIRGFFKAWLVGDEWPELTFLYSNESSDGRDFTEGRVAVLANCEVGEKAMRYSATIRDFEEPNPVSFSGWRLSAADAAVAEAGDEGAMREVVHRLAKA